MPIPAAEFSERTGLPSAVIAKARARLEAQGLVDADPGRLCTTATGFRFLDSVLSGFA